MKNRDDVNQSEDRVSVRLDSNERGYANQCIMTLQERRLKLRPNHPTVHVCVHASKYGMPVILVQIEEGAGQI